MKTTTDPDKECERASQRLVDSVERMLERFQTKHPSRKIMGLYLTLDGQVQLITAPK